MKQFEAQCNVADGLEVSLFLSVRAQYSSFIVSLFVSLWKWFSAVWFHSGHILCNFQDTSVSPLFIYWWPLFRTHLVQFPGYSGLTTTHILVTTIESTFGAPSDASLAHPGFEAREAKIYGSWTFVAINMTNMHWHWPLKIWPPMICPPILYLKLTTNAPYRIMKMLTMTCKRSPSRPSFHCTSTCILCMYTVSIYILCIHSKLYVYSVYTLCIHCWAQWQLLDSGGMVDHKEIAGAWTLISNLSNSTPLHCKIYHTGEM